MQKEPFKDTLACEAIIYLADDGQELTRAAFLDDMFDNRTGNAAKGQSGYMLYVGEGFVPLSVAVIGWDESDATDIFEQWCLKNGREEELEITDDGEYLYSCLIELIPTPVLIMPVELEALKTIESDSLIPRAARSR